MTEPTGGFWPSNHTPLRDVLLKAIATSNHVIGEEKTRAEVKGVADWIASLGADATTDSLMKQALNQ